MGYHHQRQPNAYPQDNAQGETPSSLDSSNTDAVQAANLLPLAIMITEGLHVHSRSRHRFTAATIQR